MVLVKICGLMSPKDISAVNVGQADFAGFVFAPSRHQITLKDALRLKSLLNPEIRTVGVFVNESVKTILRFYKAGAIDLAQLHSKPNPDKIKKLQRAGLKVIQVFENRSIDVSCRADYLMVDSGKGSGRLLNLKAIPHINRPLILAGGLNGQNIHQAISVASPAVVDVSSGVETAGQKDPKKIKQFIKKAKEKVIL